jgi:hypothetical protein
VFSKFRNFFSKIWFSKKNFSKYTYINKRLKRFYQDGANLFQKPNKEKEEDANIRENISLVTLEPTMGEN